MKTKDGKSRLKHGREIAEQIKTNGKQPKPEKPKRRFFVARGDLSNTKNGPHIKAVFVVEAKSAEEAESYLSQQTAGLAGPLEEVEVPEGYRLLPTTHIREG